MESRGKKNRSSNWTELEKRILRKLVIERAHIIEFKDTSTNTNVAKKRAWEEVLRRFNTLNQNNRDLPQLLNQWRNMKNKAKKSEFEFRSSRNQTGGGRPPPEDRERIEAISQDFFVDSNVFDSDTLHQQNSGNQAAAKTHKDSPPVFVPEPSPSAAGSSEWKAETSQPKTKGDLSLKQTRRKKKSNNNGCDCTENHDHQLFILAKKAREQTMQQDKEAHEARMKYMDLEAEYMKIKIDQVKLEMQEKKNK